MEPSLEPMGYDPSFPNHPRNDHHDTLVLGPRDLLGIEAVIEGDIGRVRGRQLSNVIGNVNPTIDFLESHGFGTGGVISNLPGLRRERKTVRRDMAPVLPTATRGGIFIAKQTDRASR